LRRVQRRRGPELTGLRRSGSVGVMDDVSFV
jgi:hypothetical protein